MPAPHKEKALVALKKANGLLQKVLRMAESDEYCIDVMQQNMAVMGLLKSAHQSLLQGHLEGCFVSGLHSGNAAKKRKMIEEMLAVTKLANA